jgi:uncharacterized protein with ACT and thioredoxin-like domain
MTVVMTDPIMAEIEATIAMSRNRNFSLELFVLLI